MSDVLIIGGDYPAVRLLRDTLEQDGYAVAYAPSLVAALPELYLSPHALRVVLSGESRGCAAAQALQLAAADPGPLGRHVYSTLEADAAAVAAKP
jgi:hypothetical protein